MGENGYLFRVFVKGGQKGDHAIAVDARKLALRNNVGRVNGKYKIDLEQIRVEMGEELAMELWELLMYLLPEEKVRKAIQEYAEKCF